MNNLSTFYKNIFPYKSLFKILEMNINKEITFMNNKKVYIRYESFNNDIDFYNKICDINPLKIDVGAIYREKVSKLNTNNQIIGKELVLDIDLTDYPRKCCNEKNICKNCYNLIIIAIKLLNFILKEEFGFNNFGFVFSGRRGVHCWILKNNFLNENIRNNIFNYFNNILLKPVNVAKYIKIIKDNNNDNSNDINYLIENYFIRIDKQVTVKMGHLIKMPFSVHPDTLKVSIPLDPENIKSFEDLPTVEDFIKNKEKIEEYVEIMEKWIK